MREDCCNFQSRTYDDGEVARFCTLDLAPEAPWRCPTDCPSYARLAMHSGFEPGTLARPPVESEPDGDGIAELLDDAEDIVNNAAPDVLADFDKQRQPWWRRMLGRRGPGAGNDRPRLSDR